jgi:hypothetical protein
MSKNIYQSRHRFFCLYHLSLFHQFGHDGVSQISMTPEFDLSIIKPQLGASAWIVEENGNTRTIIRYHVSLIFTQMCLCVRVYAFAHFAHKSSCSYCAYSSHNLDTL